MKKNYFASILLTTAFSIADGSALFAKTTSSKSNALFGRITIHEFAAKFTLVETAAISKTNLISLYRQN